MQSRFPVQCLSLPCVLAVVLLLETARANDQTQSVDSLSCASVTTILSADAEKHIAATDSRIDQLRHLARKVIVPPFAWYRRTAPAERIAWGGLAACCVLGLWVFAERLVRLRPRKVIPVGFASRFINSIHDGKLDCGQALDHCERNPSPAARVALAALRRWGRPSNDLERAVALAVRVECDRLRRNVSSLRRIAALSPLIGLMGTLFAVAGILDTGTAASLPAGGVNLPNLTAVTLETKALSAISLSPLIVGVVIAVLALVAYDGLFNRVEKLSGALERLGAETIDAIALMTPEFAGRPIHLAAHVPSPPSDKSTNKPHLDRGSHPVSRSSINEKSKLKRD